MPDPKSTAGGGTSSTAKWAALIDDRVVWSPGRTVLVGVLKTQCSVPENRVLVRDHSSPNDQILRDDVAIDLAAGNVFYSIAVDEQKPRDPSGAAAKLAFFVDDRPVVTTRADQTGKSLRELFNLAETAKLVRDYANDQDEVIEPQGKISFADGPVFRASAGQRPAPKLTSLSITINSRRFTEHDGVRPTMTGFQIAALLNPQDAKQATVSIVSDGGREVQLAQQITIGGGEVIEVGRTTSSGNIGTF